MEKGPIGTNKEKINIGRKFLPLVLAILAFSGSAQSVNAGGPNPEPHKCQFVFGAQDIHNRMPDIVGNCVDNQITAVSGDATQQTDKGIIYYKKADNLVAFHNQYTTYFIDPQGGALIDASSYFVNKLDSRFSSDQKTRLTSELSMLVVNAPLVVGINCLSPETYAGLDSKYPDQVPQSLTKLGSKRFMEHFGIIDSIVLGPTDYTDNTVDSEWIFLSNGQGRIAYQPQAFGRPQGYLAALGLKELSGVVIRSSTGSNDKAEDISFGIKIGYDETYFPPVTSTNITIPDNVAILRTDAKYTPGQSKYLSYLDSLPQAA